MQWRVAVLILLISCALGSCRPAARPEPSAQVWTKPQTSAFLVEGAYLRGQYPRYVQPAIVQWFVFAGARRLDTSEELRAHLRPLDSADAALGYRNLLAELHLDGARQGFHMGSPLTFRREGRRVTGEYDAEDAARWGIQGGTEIQREADVFVIRRPHFIIYDDPGPVPENVVRGWTSKVEYVEERISVDGRYERIILRVLEDGEAPTRRYGPKLIW